MPRAPICCDRLPSCNAITAPNGKYTDFDLSMWDWVGLVDPDFMLSVVTCDQYGGWSDSGYCSKPYDKMYSLQQVAATPAKRRAIVWRMQSYLYKQRPYLWLANLDSVSASAAFFSPRQVSSCSLSHQVACIPAMIA